MDVANIATNANSHTPVQPHEVEKSACSEYSVQPNGTRMIAAKRNIHFICVTVVYFCATERMIIR